MIKDTDKFRQAAIHFQKYGYYTSAPRGTTGYKEYWDEETKRCLFGWTALDGDFISGYNYFYLNYSPILIVTEREVKVGEDKVKKIVERRRDFPRFYDYDYQYFNYIEEAEKIGKHAVVIKARRKGYSYKGSSMLCRNFYLIPQSKSYAIASENEYLTKDGLLTKAWDLMSWIDSNTAWTKKRQKVDTKMHKRASYVVNNEGTMIEAGIMSEIMGITLKNDIHKARGKAGKLILWEEGGKFPGLEDAWQMARPSVEQGSNVFGLMIAYGTGGTDEADYTGLKNLFYKPDGYNILSVDNIWDEGATDRCGFFVPDYANLDGCDEDGNLFMDSDGNTTTRIAVQYALKERQKVIDNAVSRFAIDRHIAEHPFCLHGDTWVSDNGYISRIKDNPNKIYNGKSDLYKLDTVNGRTLICTSTHPIYNGKEYISLSKYKIGDQIKLLNFEFNSDYQKVDIETNFSFLSQSLVIDEEWAEFIGFFMGDGSFSSKQGCLSIVFDVKDSNSSDYISKFFVKKFGKVSIRNSTGNMIEVRISNKNFTKLFGSLDLIKLSSNDGKGYWKRNIHVPDYIIKSPKSVVSAFLRGLFDSDGCITTKTGVISFGSKFNNFVKDVLFLLSGYEIYPKYSSTKRINNKGYEYSDNKLNLRKCDNLKFSQWIRFRSDRKNDILDNSNSQRLVNTDYTLDSVKSIEFFSNEDVYNLTTNKGYYCANGLWTHNSPSEATLQLSGNIFPKKDLIRHLTYIRTNENVRNFKQVGELYNDEHGLLKWKQGLEYKDLIKYKLDKTDDRKGAIVIWEHPMDNPPWGLYIAACDPYDHDKSGTDSLGSVFIYKRFQTFEYSYDTLVAEYTGRPETAEEFYETVRKLLTYYHANVLYENQNPGLSVYFKNKHLEYMLADQPGIISKIIKDSRVSRVKGTHMVTALKDWAEGRLRDWLIEEYEPGKKNLTKIYSEPLLEELISYNDKGNFDRVSAMLILMIYKEELHELHVKKKEEIEKVNSLFEFPLFKKDIEFESFK